MSSINFNPKMNRKGQEEAPFELLVAVIIMGFVLSVGFIAMNELTKKQCQGTVENTMREFKMVIESVSKAQGSSTFSFRIPGCYIEKESRLSIRTVTEKLVCERVCGGSGLDCAFLEFYGKSRDESYPSTVCLDIPPNLDFPSADAINTPCDTKRYSGSYEIVSWKDNSIAPGDYILANEYSIVSGYPRVCVYKRK